MTQCLIIGAGIAGTAAALALHKAGLRPVIYESYEHGAEGTGGFLTVAANGLDAAGTLGLEQRIRDCGFGCKRMVLYLGTGRPLADFATGGSRPAGAPSVTIMRPALYAVLREEVLACGIDIHYGKRVVSAQETATGVAVVFGDGTSADGEVLIGADGLRSTIRTIIDPAAPPPRPSPLLNTGGVVRGYSTDSPPGVMHMVFGRRCFYSYITAPGGDMWWFANPMRKGSSSLAEAPLEEVRARLIAMTSADDTPMADILRAADTVMKPYGTFDVPSVPQWHTNRMVILGDAAHAASPASGQGASMALEDAVTLARSLRDIRNAFAAFAAFTAQRRERVERIVAFGRSNGNPKEHGAMYRMFRDLALRIVFAHQARNPNDLGWIYDHHIPWNQAAHR